DFEGDYVQLTRSNGAIIFKKEGFLYSDVGVYDVGGSEETFTSIEDLETRLIALGYIAYYNEGMIDPDNALLDSFALKSTVITLQSDLEIEEGERSLADSNLQTQIDAFAQGSIGVLMIADTPTQDGTYIAGESGTYTNAGSLVVDLTNTLTYINVEDSQTTFTLIEIPIEPDIETMVLLFSGQSNMVNGEPSMNDGGDKGIDGRVEVWDDVLGAFKIAELGQHPFPTALNDEGKYNNNLAFHISKRIAE
ncbi:MAG: hypothetical protein GY740_13815, partial [Gammaproteobacteria bacterium]|nr:hypothetical protein [Gammaproteobacteria bacterium]